MTLDDYLNQPGVTASEFATKVGLTEASISRIRKGNQNIARDVIRRIVEATGHLVSANELIFHAPATSGAGAALSPDTQSDHIGQQASGVAA